MLDFSKRSCDKELLDRDDIPFADIGRNMQELDTINTWLGGHAISIKGLKRLIGDRRSISICEIGCGGGDNLRVLDRWCRKHHCTPAIMGIDHNPHCLAVARQRWVGDNAKWVHSDYRKTDFGGESPDIIFSSLFSHHFTDEELAEQLRWMDEHAVVGWFINDLHRHPLAWWAIRLLTAGFSRSYLVKNDAPLSVLRGFRRDDWKKILQQASIGQASIRWEWAFRWLVIGRKQYV